MKGQKRKETLTLQLMYGYLCQHMSCMSGSAGSYIPQCVAVLSMPLVPARFLTSWGIQSVCGSFVLYSAGVTWATVEAFLDSRHELAC